MQSNSSSPTAGAAVIAYTITEGGSWYATTPDIEGTIYCKLDSPQQVETFADHFAVGTIAAIKLANGDVYDFILGNWRHLYGKSAASALDTQEGGDHYKLLAIQPVEYITKNKIPYLEGNVIKYVTRHSNKNGIEDIKKAIHYLQLIAELQYAAPLVSLAPSNTQ